MKEINSFIPDSKYSSPEYVQTQDGIYRCNGKYVTALSFQQEPSLGEGKSAAEISQFPLEDIIDKYCVYVSDYFKQLNTATSQTCYLEFTGFTEKDIVALRTLIGKHVYCFEVQEDGETYVKLLIE